MIRTIELIIIIIKKIEKKGNRPISIVRNDTYLAHDRMLDKISKNISIVPNIYYTANMFCIRRKIGVVFLFSFLLSIFLTVIAKPTLATICFPLKDEPILIALCNNGICTQGFELSQKGACPSSLQVKEPTGNLKDTFSSVFEEKQIVDATGIYQLGEISETRSDLSSDTKTKIIKLSDSTSSWKLFQYRIFWEFETHREDLYLILLVLLFLGWPWAIIRLFSRLKENNLHMFKRMTAIKILSLLMIFFFNIFPEWIPNRYERMYKWIPEGSPLILLSAVLFLLPSLLLLTATLYEILNIILGIYRLYIKQRVNSTFQS